MGNTNVVRQAYGDLSGWYIVSVNSVCPLHGGRNFAYQNRDENFVRWESVCEGCTSPARHEVSPEVQQSRQERGHERPERLSKR